MISLETINSLKSNWYSFEEIEWIKLGLKQSSEWKTISLEKMNNFVKNDLFSKYTSENV